LNPLVTDYGKYISNEPRKAFDWPIHPEGFSAPEPLELGKLAGLDAEAGAAEIAFCPSWGRVARPSNHTT
jgi:hypothetical protein